MLPAWLVFAARAALFPALSIAIMSIDLSDADTAFAALQGLAARLSQVFLS
jgi:hypothetical protein